MPLIFIELESLQTQSLPVWPDLVKFHHFDQYLKIFGNIFKVYLVLGKVFNSLRHNLFAFGEICIAVNEQILKTQSDHLVTLMGDKMSFLDIRAKTFTKRKQKIKVNSCPNVKLICPNSTFLQNISRSAAASLAHTFNRITRRCFCFQLASRAFLLPCPLLANSFPINLMQLIVQKYFWDGTIQLNSREKILLSLPIEGVTSSLSPSSKPCGALC